MSIIKIELTVNAPIERVFDLARCIDLHKTTMSKHKEKAIGGVTKGLIGMGESVTWEATHFGIEQNLTSKITAFERPNISAIRWSKARSDASTTTISLNKAMDKF